MQHNLNITTFFVSVILLFSHCTNNMENTSNISENNGLKKPGSKSSIEIMVSSIRYATTTLPYIKKQGDYSHSIDNISVLIDEFSNAKKLWDAYQLVPNNETAKALVNLLRKVTIEIDNYFLLEIGNTRDEKILKELIIWCEKTTDNKDNTEILARAKKQLAGHIKKNKTKINKSYLTECQYGIIINGNTPKMPTYKKLKIYYSSYGVESYAHRNDFLSMIDFIELFQQKSTENLDVYSQELTHIKKYYKILRCSMDCEIIDCLNEHSIQLDQLINDVNKIRMPS